VANFLITGGTGFIGKQLVAQLVNAGHEAVVVTRRPEKHEGTFAEKVRYIGSFSAIDNSDCFDAVINLGGEGIADKRWSAKRKQQLLDSRIGLTNHLVKCLARLEKRPEVMISASAVGWYGAHDETPLTEDSACHEEFSHALCEAWEKEAAAVGDLGIRLCIIRLGIVLEKNGGVLKRMLPPFYFGLGGRIGSGQQYMSWVHVNDVIRAVHYLVDDNSLSGVFNLTAPGTVSNTQFTQTIGKVISRPTLFSLPAFVVKTIFGEMGERLLLMGQSVVPHNLLQAGFSFDFPDLDGALTDILIH